MEHPNPNYYCQLNYNMKMDCSLMASCQAQEQGMVDYFATIWQRGCGCVSKKFEFFFVKL